MAGAYDAYVLRVDDQFFVRPSPVIVTARAGQVWVRNLTDFPITLTLPAKLVPNAPEGGKPVPRWPAKSLKTRRAAVSFPSRVTARVEVAPHRVAWFPLDRKADGAHQFAVDVLVASHFSVRALGNSWPILIVDP